MQGLLPDDSSRSLAIATRLGAASSSCSSAAPAPARRSEAPRRPCCRGPSARPPLLPEALDVARLRAGTATA
ncbi:MAG: hypothetical protein QOK40_3166 [Miltoncostaeaceae bacterium]|nr:hypothetical protein [Miltoncostaeaceae bacterium]